MSTSNQAPSCIVCGSKKFIRKLYNKHTQSRALSYVKQFLKWDLSEDFPFKGWVRICSACGHGVMETPPSQAQLEEYYQKQYWASRPTLTEKVKIAKDAFKSDLRADHQINFVNDRLNLVDIHEILEIGAGPAFASLALRHKAERPLRLNVCEPGKNWHEYYRENDINNVAPYFPFETSMMYDYIHTSHWLEHVLELEVTVIKLKQFLRPGGFIFVEVPNTEHYYWDLSLSDTPHIQFFTKSSLSKVFEKNGFECLKVGTFGQTFQEKYNRIPLSEHHYKASDKGFWIRTLFRKR